MMKVLFALLLVVACNCQDLEIVDLVNDIFNPSNTSRPTTTSRPNNRGFGNIVTPEPILEPTSEPQILVQNGKRCICVPYYLCDPDTNMTFTDGRNDGFGLIDIRFDPDTCQDVLDVCCAEGRMTTEPVTPAPVVNPPTGCGIRHQNGVDFQILENTNNVSEFGEFPWVVAMLESNSRYFCGGTLIHPQVVLTGQHCVANRPLNTMKVRAGEWDSQTIKERLPYQERGIRQVINHPEFNPKSIPYDFSLLVLERPFDLDEHINIVCLPPQGFVSTSTNCFSTGWGKDLFGKEGKWSSILKRIPLPTVPHAQCEQQMRATRLGPRFNLHSSFVCAGGQRGVDTCQGDGGSPLVCPFDTSNRYYLYGLVAWGIGCNEERPAAYANVPLVRNWIDQQMSSLGFDTKVYTN